MEAVRDLSMCISLEYILPYRFTSFLEVLEIFSWSTLQCLLKYLDDKKLFSEPGLPRPGGPVPDPGELVTNHCADIPAPSHVAEQEIEIHINLNEKYSPEVDEVLPLVLLVQRPLVVAVHQPEDAEHVSHVFQHPPLRPYHHSVPSYTTSV